MDILQAFRDELNRPTVERPLSSWLLPNQALPPGIPTPDEEALQDVVSPAEAMLFAPSLYSAAMRGLLSLATPTRTIERGMEGLAGNDVLRNLAWTGQAAPEAVPPPTP